LLEKTVTTFFGPNYLIPDVFGKAFGLGGPWKTCWDTWGVVNRESLGTAALNIMSCWEHNEKKRW